MQALIPFLLVIAISAIVIGLTIYQTKQNSKNSTSMKGQNVDNFENINQEVDSTYQKYLKSIQPYKINGKKIYTGPFPGPFDQPIQGLKFNKVYKSTIGDTNCGMGPYSCGKDFNIMD